ncbi:hypothetical protein [Providencia sneebia]|uniref:Uncharacterized protein n=1 Tax=Providencia sneebia DSM 19967 TaxID=1141660 RepID=K8WHS1_9GAMM|nr:hypothetical protein [Providencia sneebia]EKT60094.1 hypothetical protein OO7_04684 [Providencia sneebia DSM 19967]
MDVGLRSSGGDQPNTTTGLKTTDVESTFKGYINKADDAVNTFLAANTEDGVLSLSSSGSLELQRLMADQSISAQTATATLKSIKDSISAAARNI